MSIEPINSRYADEKIQSSSKVRTGQLWGKSKDDLKKQLVDLKTELGQLRTQKIAGGASSKLHKMYARTASLISFHFIPCPSSFSPWKSLIEKANPL